MNEVQPLCMITFQAQYAEITNSGSGQARHLRLKMLFDAKMSKKKLLHLHMKNRGRILYFSFIALPVISENIGNV
jgi:hypothetical protein